MPPSRIAIVEVLEPRQDQDQRSEEEAPVEVGPDDHEDRDRPQATGMGPSIDDEQQHDGEDRHPEELRPEGERDGRDDERRERQPRRAARAEAAAARDQVDAAEDDPDQRRPQEDETGPAADAVDAGQDDLGAPLLVDPRGAGGRVRPGVDGRRIPPPARIWSPARRW